jgi:hypothetical protein
VPAMSSTLRPKHRPCLESETDPERFAAIFEHLRALALPADEPVELIRGVARDL